MSGWIGAVAALALQSGAAPQTGWTWSLYESQGPVVLAEEIPDTRYLRLTMECEPHSGVAQLSIYGEGFQGFATAQAGAAAATAEATRVRDATRLALRVDHPVFVAFAADGELNLTLGEQKRAVVVPRAHLAKLRRFVQLCGD